jgi:hypothetical protein
MARSQKHLLGQARPPGRQAASHGGQAAMAVSQPAKAAGTLHVAEGRPCCKLAGQAATLYTVPWRDQATRAAHRQQQQAHRMQGLSHLSTLTSLQGILCSKGGGGIFVSVQQPRQPNSYSRLCAPSRQTPTASAAAHADTVLTRSTSQASKCRSTHSTGCTG